MTAIIPNPILYSAMTLVAYNVNKKYYGGLHYMWCTPYFSSDYKSPHYTVPPSSSPFEIYKTIEHEINSGEQHGIKIKSNRTGLIHGAESMLKRGIISNDDRDEIVYIATKSPTSLFRPLLCVISKIEAVPHLKKVPISDKANPLSYEYILADLPQSAFDIIRIG